MSVLSRMFYVWGENLFSRPCFFNVPQANPFKIKSLSLIVIQRVFPQHMFRKREEGDGWFFENARSRCGTPDMQLKPNLLGPKFLPRIKSYYSVRLSDPSQTKRKREKQHATEKFKAHQVFTEGEQKAGRKPSTLAAASWNLKSRRSTKFFHPFSEHTLRIACSLIRTLFVQSSCRISRF